MRSLSLALTTAALGVLGTVSATEAAFVNNTVLSEVYMTSSAKGGGSFYASVWSGPNEPVLTYDHISERAALALLGLSTFTLLLGRQRSKVH